MSGRFYFRYYLLFFYDLARFLAISSLLVTLLGTTKTDIAFAPLVFFFAPQALFPLIMYFVSGDAAEYHNFRFLYIAGKVLSVVSFAAWVLFGFDIDFFVDTLHIDGLKGASSTLLPLLITFLDIFSIIIAAWRRKK